MDVHITAVKRPTAGQLEEALLHVISSNRQLMTKAYQGRVLIKTDFSDGTIHVKITSNSPEITSDNLETVDEPFVTTRRNEGGSCSRLNAPYGMINEHGDLITGSKPGKANSLVLELPVMLAQDQNPKENANPEIFSQKITSGTEVRILIVDDEIDIREAIKRILSANGSVPLTRDNPEWESNQECPISDYS